jgi:hypothetical protein
MTPWGEVIPLHRGARLTTIELSYARQGKAFRPDPIDLRVRQLKSDINPPLSVVVSVLSLGIAAFCIVYFGAQLLRIAL